MIRSSAILLAITCLFFPYAGEAADPVEGATPNSVEEAAPTPPRIPRQRPGGKPRPARKTAEEKTRALPYEFIPVPDRWRIVESVGVEESWFDPYNRNPLKADRPVFGKDWFVNIVAISDSLFEPRRVPTPVGAQGNRRSSTLDIFGDEEQYLLSETLIFSLSLLKGDTVFKPPDYEFRFTPVWNFNYTRAEVVGLLHIDPRRGIRRYDHDFGIQELFVDKHLRNVSDRYDFDSLRVGIQGFSSDFRGFLFQDNQPGIRLFGTRWNNRIQYNLAWFNRLEKDINSGLNSTFQRRKDHIFLANVYLQDFPVLGFTLQATAIHNNNDEGERRAKFDKNGFIQRPPPRGDERPYNYQVTYLGLNGDGHVGRANLTFAGYYVFGDVDRDVIARRDIDVSAYMAAAELSIDFDWVRLKLYGLAASGDNQPFDDEANGFDAIFENPQFAGAETSFFLRQGIPLIAGGGLAVSGRNGLLPSLRSSKEQGQSNFVNPGLGMVGIGADLDVLPELRVTVNASYLDFENTSVLRVLRAQGPIDNHIGEDVSVGIIYRPFFSNNIVLRASGAVLFPGDGFKQLFNDGDRKVPYYSALANLVLTY